MRRYETIVIIDPDVPESDRTVLITRLKEIIQQQEGAFIQEDPWGTKKMAYEIKKKSRGFYTRMDYCGMGNVVDELERFCRIDDRVMKYLTVQLSPEADVEKIRADIAAAQVSASQPASAESEKADASQPLASDEGMQPNSESDDE
jgi:small subunit ribosomal protein S6